MALLPSPTYSGRLGALESSSGKNVVNPLSTARGPYQFLEGTWADLQKRFPQAGLTDRNDPAQQERALPLYTEGNRARLRQLLGRDPTENEIYTAHRLGADGAAKVILAKPGTPVEALLSTKVLAVNPDLQGKTADRLLGDLGQKFSGSGGTETLLGNPGKDAASDWSPLGSGNGLPKSTPAQPETMANMRPELLTGKWTDGPTPNPWKNPDGGYSTEPLAGFDLSKFMQPEKEDPINLPLLTAAAAIAGGQGIAPAMLGYATMAQKQSDSRQGRELDKIKTALELRKLGAPEKPIEVNGRLIDPRTFEVIADFSERKAPTTREVKKGDSIVTQEFRNGQWADVAEAPRGADTTISYGTPEVDPATGLKGQRDSRGQWHYVPGQEGGAQTGPFSGNAIDAQSYNIIAGYEGKKARGEATTPDEDYAYRLAKYQIESAKTVGSPATGYFVQAPAAVPSYGGEPSAGPKITQIAPPVDQKRLQAIDNFGAALAQLKNEVEQPGGVDFVGDRADRIQARYRDILLQLKEAQNLGVLNGPDLQQLESQLRDPGGLGTAWRFAFGRGASSLLEQIKVLEEKIARERAVFSGQKAPTPDASGAAAAAERLSAMNPATGQRIYSDDGGVTWKDQAGTPVQ